MSTPEPIARAIPTERYCEGGDVLDDELDDADGEADMVGGWSGRSPHSVENDGQWIFCSRKGATSIYGF